MYCVYDIARLGSLALHSVAVEIKLWKLDILEFGMLA